MKANQIIDSWQKVSIAQYQHLLDLQEKDRLSYAKAAVEYLYDVEDAEQLPMQEYVAMVAGLRQFSDRPLVNARLSNDARYTVNGRVYVVDFTPSDFNTGQYIDFTNSVKGSARMEDILAVVIIPEGHKYNDGYDMEQAKEDIGSLPCTVGFAVMRFFAIWSRRFIQTSLSFLTSQTMKTKNIEAGKLKELKARTDELQTLLASFPIF